MFLKPGKTQLGIYGNPTHMLPTKAVIGKKLVSLPFDFSPFKIVTWVIYFFTHEKQSSLRNSYFQKPSALSKTNESRWQSSHVTHLKNINSMLDMPYKTYESLCLVFFFVSLFPFCLNTVSRANMLPEQDRSTVMTIYHCLLGLSCFKLVLLI